MLGGCLSAWEEGQAIRHVISQLPVHYRAAALASGQAATTRAIWLIYSRAAETAGAACGD